MRVRASLLLPLAAATAFAAVQTASGAPAAAPGPSGGGLQPAMAAVAVELVDARSLQRRASWTPPAHKLAVVRGGVALSHRPGGPARRRVGSVTEFGSPRVLGVAKRRGDWLGVVTTERPNNRLAWVRRGTRGLRLRRTRWSLHADLSARSLVLRKAGRRVMRVVVAVGRPGSETPTGRFAVTDKLSGPRFGSYYGCCILALSGHQPNLPPGWTGGNRLAIHGTNAPSTIGAAASAGCLRAADAPLRVLMRKVPLGTPVFIRN
jgi:L,D-transpeptidase catalytic domain